MLTRRCCLLLCLVSLLVAPALAKDKKAKPKNDSLDTDNVAQRIVASTNDFRRQEGRSQIHRNQVLTETALEFARFLSRSDKFGHEADRRRPDERAKQHGYDYCIVLENIAYQYNSDGFKADELAH